MNPGKVRERVRSDLNIPNPEFLLLHRVWNVIVIAPRRTDETELVFRRRVENQGGESREAYSLIMKDRDIDAFKSAIGPASGYAAVISEPVRVASKIQEFVCLVAASISGHEFAEFISFET